MVSCLYASDYGPPDPSFNAVAEGLVLPGTPHAAELARAQNLPQLEAMQRKLQHNEPILWCDQGYAWVYQPLMDDLFGVVLVVLVLPYLVKRLRPQRWLPRLRGGALSGELQ